ncbi:protein translocase subunit SecD [Aquabacterium fontiphilum]|jgi:preprotein translocase subunit SecD|uniref:protein translocase subunit SecD n=1 Tax=Aquabacterium fontiphilum TaxID=450365 RepID=UPI001378324F|nr:protein translocase subunit SecD [Aquabacterium fontiphilum]NBD21133.1 protein translocase subunit SecD [Aquabacterium fontiphilum]
MNRYAWWKYLVIAVALVLGFLYTLPNFFGEAPAVQLSSGKATVKLSSDDTARVSAALDAAGIKADFVEFEGTSIRARFKDTDTQIKARDAIQRAFNPDATDPSYIVALNLVSRSPQWLRTLHAQPMYLGLDLRGGVHFLMQVDMKGALSQRLEGVTGDARTLLRDKDVRHSGIRREGTTVVIRFRDAATRNAARPVLANGLADLAWVDATDGSGDLTLVGTLLPQAERAIQEQALKQNITTLHNRINELGVAEPVIQQQGADRVVVQLPGVQDTARAKDIIGRTATLEVRLVDDSTEAQAALVGGPVPFGTERYLERDGTPLIVKRQVVLTGDNLTDAQAGFDENREPAVHLTLDARGARIFRDVTRENVGKRMAILLFEKGRGEVVTAPVIRGEIAGGRVQISGRMTTNEAADTALLLRAGSLAAPMEIIEERTVGPSLGAENIAQGFNSLVWGFVAIAVFMTLYYMLFGVFSTLALTVNLLLLIAVLSMLQATLTLPGIAAIALTLGMAIDANVLINERIREELRNGSAPQTAIHAGYEHAWATILDSNVTTLIAGVALLAFGSGPVRGFAVVHCLGILTSMFSAVFFSRGLVNLWYGRQKKLKSVSIGQVWKPQE